MIEDAGYLITGEVARPVLLHPLQVPALLYDLPYISAIFIGVAAAVGGGLLVDLISGRPVAVVHRGPWNATAALVGGSVYAATAALGAPTGVSQAATFIMVVAMRLASLRWGLQTPLPADLGQKLTPRRHQGDQQAPQDGTEDKPQ